MYDTGFLMLLFVPYLLLCMIPSYMAEKRGRSGIGWFFLSIFVTPF